MFPVYIEKSAKIENVTPFIFAKLLRTLRALNPDLSLEKLIQ